MERNSIARHLLHNPRRSRHHRPEVDRLEPRSLLAILTVNTVGDADIRDDNLSLREAIRLANGEIDHTLLTVAEHNQLNGIPLDSQPDEIRFAISGPPDDVHVIEVTSALPKIRDMLTIDGYSQPGALPATGLTPAELRVVLDGKFAGDGVNGLTVESTGCLIRGLVINQFRMNVATERDGFGIVLSAEGGSSRVEGCYLGTNAEGTLAQGNQSGIGIFSRGNTIGGTTPAARNLCSGNGYNGIQVGGEGGLAVTANQILGNYVGLSADGDSPLPNENGIRVTIGAFGNFIGGSLPGGGNVLSGNRYQGVLVDSESGSANVIQGNRIGTDPTGLTTDPDSIPGSGDELGNGDDGIDISGGADHIIGGPSFDFANVVAGNGGAGILVAGAGRTNIDITHNLVGCDLTGTKAFGNEGPGVELQDAPGNRIEDNVLSGNEYSGLRIYGPLATNNQAQGNRIGTDLSGTDFLGNGKVGVEIWNAPSNTIGGPRPNTISGNGYYGVYITGATATLNQLLNNRIGTDLSGLLPLGNFYDGVRVVDAPNNTIGGTSLADRNVISGNTRHGIQISGAGSSGNTITFNYIGMDVQGSSMLPNDGDGVVVRDASGVQIGTSGPAGRGNLISGNLGYGIRVEGPGCSGTGIASNYVGTDVGALQARGNGKGGILLDNTSGVLVGGERSLAGNLISGHATGAGITLSGNGANVLQGNYVGTDKNGEKALANFTGVDVIDSANNLIGGPSSTLGNLVSGNSGEAILIFGTKASGNRLQGNLIGLQKDGDSPLGNGGTGISIQDAAQTLIGVPMPTGSIVGNVIAASGGYGILVQGPNTGGTTIRDNFIGTNRTGDAARGNRLGGIRVENSHGITIGGIHSPEGNLISGNTGGPGIAIRDGGSHIIQGNYVGLVFAGTGPLPNLSGIEILDSSWNTLGGASANRGNRISGNQGDGVLIDGANVVGNVLEGNFIGVQPDGISPLGNLGHGVVLAAPSNKVGVPAGVPNVISANAGHGIVVERTTSTANLIQNNRIGTDLNGVLALGNALGGIRLEDVSFTRIGGSNPDGSNLISGHLAGPGLAVLRGGFNAIEGNFIGTDLSGQLPLPNQSGIEILDSSRNTIGGASPTLGNLISGNTTDGVLIDGPTAFLNALQGNTVGLNRIGDGLLPNGGHGIVISAPSNYIGVTPGGLRNLVSGNTGYGILVENPHATGNVIQNNFIGTNLAGDAAQANLAGGICLENVSETLIGGVRFPEGNLISGHALGNGILIHGGFGNRIEGNFIGTDEQQKNALGNFVGILIQDSFRNIVGASANSPAATGGVADPARGNRIAGNFTHGIVIAGALSQYNEIKGNDVGRSVDGFDLGNGQDGIAITAAASLNQIGAMGTHEGNVIAFNRSRGVSANSGSWNAIRGNSIYVNQALDIDLNGDGVTANDTQDSDAGPNGLQNYPVLISALASGPETVVQGWLDSIPGVTFQIDFFTAAVPNPSGHYGGELYLETQTVTVPPAGMAFFTRRLATAIPPGFFLTVTATSIAGDTSEFSAAQIVLADSDADGASDDQEAAGPGGGDANHDGAPDAAQPNVASVPNQVDGSYLVLEAPDGSSLANVQAHDNPAPATSPPGVSFPIGFVSFVVQDVAVGGAAHVILLLPSGVHVNSYYKFGPTPDESVPHWYEFAYDGTTGAEILPDRIVLHFVDGLRGDHDLLANGVVVDPGGGAIETAANLSVTMNATPDPVPVGSSLAYSMVVANQGPVAATDITATFELPVGMALISASSSQGTFSVNGDEVTFVLGDLAVAADAQLSVVAQPFSEGSHTARVALASATPELDPVDNQAVRSVTVTTIDHIVVNAADDVDDGSLDATHTSLREAIRFANGHPGLDTIVFAIPGPGVHTIRPVGPGLPAITDPLILDATTQPGYDGRPVIELDGSLLTATAMGLTIYAGSSLVRGLAINRFPFDGLSLKGSAGILLHEGNNNVIESCFIGTDPTGTTGFARPGQRGNQLYGIVIHESTGNTIGGTAPGSGNLISGHVGIGIAIELFASTNVVVGNFIGTDISGTRVIPNGMGVSINSASEVRIGPGNLISGNETGINVISGGIATAYDNRIEGNRIGTDVTGLLALPNREGIVLRSAGYTRIGGTDPTARNIVSGNISNGIVLRGEVDTDGTGAGTVVEGNWIGVDATGIGPLGNGGYGILVDGPVQENRIGGTTSGSGNRIAHNGLAGIAVGEPWVSSSQVWGISILGNAIYANDGPGIDLATDGETPNDADDADDGPNGLQNSPEFALQPTPGGWVAQVSLDSAAETSFRIELFLSPGPEPSGSFQGRAFLTAFDVRTNADGLVSFDAALGFLPAGSVITATATVLDGPLTASTSEFGVGRQVPNPPLPVNRPPSASDDASTTLQGQRIVIPVLVNDSDPDGDELEVLSVADAGIHGFLAIDGGTVVYQPRGDYIGEDVFTYMVGDGRGDLSTATVRVSVIAVNRPPSAGADAASTTEGAVVTIDVTANDNDPDGNLDPSTVNVILAPWHGSVLVDSSTGRITYTSAAVFVGADRFDYLISDRDGLSASARVWVEVTSTNVPPIAGGDSATTPEQIPIPIDVLANDRDADGALDPSSLRVLVSPLHGSIVIERDPTRVRYWPHAGFVGSDQFTYEIRDDRGASSSASVVVTVTPTPEPPLARDDSTSTVQGASVAVAVAANDTDPDGDLDPTSVRLTSAPRGGSVWVDSTSGEIRYTPLATFAGADIFGYEIADRNGAWGRAIVSVIVSLSSSNTPPVGVSDTFAVAENGRLAIAPPGILANDSDAEGQPLTALLVSPTSHGQLTLNADGSLTYDPDRDYVGEDRFTYRVSDGTSSSEPVTVTLVVNPASVIRFDRQEFRIGEGDGKAVITLTRSAGLGGRSTVVLTTGGGTATPGMDYSVTQITVVFEPGVFTQTIAIPILEDLAVEGDEWIGLALSDPGGGAVLGSPALAALTVLDNDRVAPDRDGPKVVSVIRKGYHWIPTRFLVKLDEDLNPARATNVRNFGVWMSGPDHRFGTRDDRRIRLRSAVYNPATRTVALSPRRLLPLRYRYRLVINGTSATGVTDRTGNLLDGNRDGRPGGDYVTTIQGFGKLPRIPTPTLLSPPRW